VRPRSVVHLAWEFPPLLYGGLGRHVDALARAQAAAGLDVTVVTARQDVTGTRRRRPPRTGRAGGVRVLRVDRAPGAAPWSDPAAAAGALGKAMAAALADRPRPDVVHAHDWMAAPGAVLVRAQAGVPVALTVHATEHGRRQGRLDGALPRAVHALERRAVAAADAVLVCSTPMAAEAGEVLGAPPGGVHVVPAGVDASAWRVGPARRAAARSRWAARGPLLVAAGRLEWEKGFSTLLRALPALAAHRPGLRLVLAGRGSYEPVLRRLAEDLGVAEAVAWAGWLAGPELAALYAAADAVVVPSRYEPFGLAALEAQAAGALLVATGSGGLADTVRPGGTGLRFEVGDVDGLAGTLGAALDDPAGSARLAAAGRAAARERTWAATAVGVSAVYDEVLGAGR
jgi:glycogen(starch) synthase